MNVTLPPRRRESRTDGDNDGVDVDRVGIDHPTVVTVDPTPEQIALRRSIDQFLLAGKWVRNFANDYNGGHCAIGIIWEIAKELDQCP